MGLGRYLSNVEILEQFKENCFKIFIREQIVNMKIPWVPEPRNLDGRKLVRGKERRKKGGSGQMITQPRFGAGQRDYESIRSPFAQ